ASATGGAAFGMQPVVKIEDSGGNTVTNDPSTVTLAITSGTGTSGAALSGCTSTTSAGVASFSGCKINKSGTGYMLTATDGTDGLSATSSSFTVAVGPGVQLVYSTEPGGATAGTAFTTQPVVTIQDAGGNTVASDASTV